MATKKGPPVPPRPRARKLEHLSTNQCLLSQTLTNDSVQGRTLVYQRSPGDSISQPHVSKTVTQILTRDKGEGSTQNAVPAPRPRFKPSALTKPLLTSTNDKLRFQKETVMKNGIKSLETVKDTSNDSMLDVNKSKNTEYPCSSSIKPQDPDSKTVTQNLSTIDFSNKVLCEMEVIINKNMKKGQELPIRPEPEGKEGHNFCAKSVEERICESKFAFSKKLMSELTAMRQTDSKMYANEASVIKEREVSNIRRSDWIEVEDNGKPVLMTSCHISLEDSGMEDEEKPDDCSSGVGDSWDSVKESEER